jgi:ligand-binding sensor domain-containing protein
MKKAIYHFLTLFSLITGHSAFSQTVAWTQYDTNNSGLPNNSVRCIAFENDSTAWIGTDFGLVKFSNGVWTNFNTLNSGLGNNDIRSIAIDTNKVKWIGTFANGISVYNDTTWTILNTQNSPLPDDFVRSLAIDQKNTKWIGTLAGLAKIDSTNSWFIYTMFNSVLGSNNIASIFVNPNTNDKWAGTVNGGLLLVEKDTNLTAFTNQNSGIPDNTILGIDMDVNQNLYLATPGNGLAVKLAGFGWLTFNIVSSNIPTSSLTSVALNAAGKPWVGTNTNGLAYNSNGNNFIPYDTGNSPLTDNLIQTIRMSADQKLWIGTQTGGLFILDPSLLTGVQALTATPSLNVYPNPCTDFLYIESMNPIQKIELWDVRGSSISLPDATNNKIKVQSLVNGMYQVRLTEQSGKTHLKKIIVNH